jgi:pimeloyl-ACP methyl ester carboxylesterase
MHARVAVERGTEARTPVVLIHGFVLASRVMSRAGQLLARDFPVYVPDLPGFGESDKPPTQTLTQAVESLNGWLQARGIERASFIGNSMGCQIMIGLAVTYPQRVARMVLQGPSVEPNARSYDGISSRLMTNMVRERDRALNAIAREDYQSAGLPRVFKTASWAFKDEPEKALPKVQCPVLVIRGDNDPVVSQAWAERCASLPPDGRLINIPDACHTLHFVHAGRFVEAIRPFLFEGEAAPAPAPVSAARE